MIKNRIIYIDGRVCKYLNAAWLVGSENMFYIQDRLHREYTQWV